MADYRLSNGDPGCTNVTDSSEIDGECDDLIDNDGDSATDYPNDAGCIGYMDNDETNCGDGVCEGGETQANCQQDCGYLNSCSDTDGGNIVTVFGTVSGYYNNSQYSNDDYCIDNTTITEYYCSGTYAYNSPSSCEGNLTTSCSNGACV